MTFFEAGYADKTELNKVKKLMNTVKLKKKELYLGSKKVRTLASFLTTSYAKQYLP